ncbi:MAG: sigma-70 family RNA polymerase sigma factor [Thermomicrobiales bacterium]|nr:sigma-70 family RNA polymerase sigma factor [Thermomicrobiales bacterium]
MVETEDAAPNDEVLVAAARHDRSAFGPLYHRYVDRVFRFCCRRLGDRAAAEDATSRIFERALASLPSHHDGPFRAWLFTIARNTVIDMHRVNRYHQPLDVAFALPDGRPGPEEQVLMSAESGWICGLLMQLTREQRQIVELRLAGLSGQEIADVLGQSHASVRSSQHRALRRLRAMIDQQERRHATPRP